MLGNLVKALSESGDVQLIEPGDSGGPLFQPAGGFKLCGINSRLWPLGFSCDGIPPFMSCAVKVENHHTVVDRQSVAAWFLPNTVDSTQTRFKGTCDVGPAVLRDGDLDEDGIPDACDVCPRYVDYNYDLSTTPDTDEDGVPDRCDNCPTITNPPRRILSGDLWVEFQLVADDQDNDGIGDACDWCLTEASSNQIADNCNYETELTLYYPGQTAPPIIKESAPNKAAELQKYHDAFKVGECEPAPCPTVTLTHSAAGAFGTLPPGKHPTNTCINAATGKQCAWVARNVVTHRPLPSDETDGRLGNVHAKWCRCERLADRSTAFGRFQCQADPEGCAGLDSRFLDPRWRNITTTDVENADWNPSISPITSSETAGYVFDGSVSRLRRWDYTTLPFVTNIGGHPSIKGVLWNSVRTFPSIALGDPALDSVLRQRGNSLETGDAFITQVGGGSKFPIPSGGGGGIDDECWPCSNGLSTLLIDPTNLVLPANQLRAFKPTPWGMVSVELNPLVQQVLWSAASGAGTLLVPAAESAGRIESLNPNLIAVRAIEIEEISATPTKLLGSSFSGAIQAVPISRTGDAVVASDGPMLEAMGVPPGPEAKLRAASLAAEPGPTSILDREGIVLSAVRGRLWLFGGSMNGAPASTAWLLDLRRHEWTEFAFQPAARVGNILAATYRVEDDSLYALHTDGKTVTLSVWPPASRGFEQIEVLPPPWRGFQEYWIRAGAHGDVILLANRDGAAVLARFSPTAERVAFAGMKLLPKGVLGRPLVGKTSVSYPTPESGKPPQAVLETTAFSELGPPPKGWAPTKP